MDLQPEKKLRRCHNGNQFWTANGNQFWTLYDLAQGLQNMDDHTFGHHVNHERNDFHAWVNDVVGDSTLAQGLLHLHDRQSMMRRVVLRIRFLELMKDSSSALRRPAARSARKTTRKTAKKAPARKKATAKKSTRKTAKRTTRKKATAKKKTNRTTAKRTTRKKTSARNTRKKSTRKRR